MNNPQPNPEVWPQCPTCKAAYVLRRCLSMSRGWCWLWQRDCKHKTPAVIVDTNGPTEATP